MRKPLRKGRYWPQLNQNSGQAMVEYILMLGFAILFVAILGSSFKKSVVALWGYYIRQISAACPSCPANPSYRFH